DHLQASLNLTDGPLFRAALVRGGPSRPARLLVGAHHLVVDGMSWRIILEDLFTSYRGLVDGTEPALPPKTTAYPDWATQVNRYAGSTAAARELDYWTSLPYHLAPPLPGTPEVRPTDASTAVVRTELDPALTQVLLRGDVEAALLCAVSSAFARWTGGRYVHFDVQRHAREDFVPGVDITRTVGWFADAHPVVLPVAAGDQTCARLNSVSEHLSRVPNHGAAYGSLRYLRPDSPLRTIVRADVAFIYQGHVDSVVPTGFAARILDEPPGRLRAPSTPRQYLIVVMAAVFRGRLSLGWSYATSVHDPTTMNRLAQDTLATLQELARQ
ncbi:MAG TPA: condensation domain-containing protein, partial [Micromonosporaceae bacterium]